MSTIEQSVDLGFLDMEEFIACYGRHVKASVRKYIPQRHFHAAERHEDVEDVMQETFIRLWKSLFVKRRSVRNVEAYITTTVRNLCNDMRRGKHIEQIPLDVDIELQLVDEFSLQRNKGMGDPAYEFEQEESLQERLRLLREGIEKLSRGQKHAMVARLQDRPDDTEHLLSLLEKHGFDLSTMRWSKIIRILKSQKTSLSIARKKLRQYPGAGSITKRKRTR